MLTMRRMFDHAQWANRKLLNGIMAARPENRRISATMAHIIHAEWIWATRLMGQDSGHIAIWPDIELAECQSIMDQNESSYHMILSGMIESDLERVIRYRNQTGQTYETPVRDILLHVAMHGQYHRGQINTMLKSEGKEPVSVDMILYARELAGQ